MRGTALTSSGTNKVHGQGYDGAGNQTSVNGLTVSYDAENHPSMAWEPQSQGGGSVSYWYDGLGERTVRALPTQEFVYAFDAFGQLAVKYAQGTTPVQEYIWFGSQLLATENSNNGSPCSTCYFVWDHLGSTRLVLDQYANVIARHDYLPFGEEIPAGYAGRDSSFGVNDSLDQKFTGQQRDGESGEDNFNARYFAGSMGRFMSPDPMNAGAVLTDPQTWNGYAYVRNNPMALVDPSGMTVTCSTDANGNFSCYDDDPQPSNPPPPGDSGSDICPVCLAQNLLGGSGTQPPVISVARQPIPTIGYRLPTSLDPPKNGQTASKIGWCFVKGAAVGAGTALVVAAVATVAAPVVGATAVTVGLGALAVAGTAALAVSASSDISARNWAGVAYDAGSVVGGLAAGFGTGASVAKSIDPNATPGWSPQSWLQQRFDPSKGSLAQWMGTGPTHASAGLATGSGGFLGSLFGGCR